MSALPKRLPLPGIANPNAVAHRLLVDGPAPGPRMAADTAKHLATHYGSLAFEIARMANENPNWPGASTRTRRRSRHRSPTPATTSGPRRPTTCCAAARR